MSNTLSKFLASQQLPAIVLSTVKELKQRTHQHRKADKKLATFGVIFLTASALFIGLFVYYFLG